VDAGEPLGEIHYRTESQLEEAMPLLEYAWHFDAAKPAATAPILEALQ
jgi:hypothetical protein